MKKEIRNLAEMAPFNEDGYLVLIDDSLDFKALKGWKTQEKDEDVMLIPTNKKTCTLYIKLYMQQFDESKITAYICLENLLEEYPDICDSKLLSNLFAKECKKDNCEKDDYKEELLEDGFLEDVLAIDNENLIPPYDPFDNTDSFFFSSPKISFY